MPRTRTSGKVFHSLVEYNKKRKLPNEKVFVENSDYPRHRIKKRIIEENLLKYECEECGNEGFHNGKPLVLQLDHKNGINNDHRIENLRFLCPNCHTQQDTYAAKNIGKKQYQ